jgi:ketosteroid isomerase-like protein
VAANAEVTRRFIEAFNAGDLDAFAETLDPDVEIHSMKCLRRGLDEARLWATKVPGGVQQTIEIEELRECGDDRVLALVTRRWCWHEDDEPAGEDELAWLFELRDGKIVSWRPFDVRDDGIAAADPPSA